MSISEELKKEYKQKIQQFSLMDDTFMTKVFEDSSCVEEMLHIILKKDLKVTKVQTQYVIENLQGRSVRLDIRAVDSQSKIYDIEIQNSDAGADVRRARYNSSLIDAHELDKSKDFNTLPETYIIFITKNDVLGGNKLIYHIDRTIKEMDNAYFGDDAHIIYIFSKSKDEAESELGRLMHDFYCTNANDMYNKTIADRVRYFKENDEGVDSMCAIMEEIAKNREIKTKLATRLEDIKNIMSSFNFPIEKAMEILKIPESEQEIYIKMLGEN